MIAQETMVCADPATAARVAEHVLAQPGVRTGPQARKATATAVIHADPAAAHPPRTNRPRRPLVPAGQGHHRRHDHLGRVPPGAESLAIDRRLTDLAEAATRARPAHPAAVRADIATALLLGQPVTTSRRHRR